MVLIGKISNFACKYFMLCYNKHYSIYMDTSHDIGREFGSLKEKADFPESGHFLNQKIFTEKA